MIHIDVGGEGRYGDAINLNKNRTNSTDGTLIPNLRLGKAESMPFADDCADLVTVENAPLNALVIDEVIRITKPGGLVRLLHPDDYGRVTHANFASCHQCERCVFSDFLDR